MKLKLILAALSLSSAVQAAPAVYNCYSGRTKPGVLKIYNNKYLEWSEEHAAGSAGNYIGREENSFSLWKGYDLYHLKDFYTTADSSYIIAIRSLTPSKINAYVYFDNDGHDENVVSYNCTKSN